jgi:hypothetical protein
MKTDAGLYLAYEYGLATGQPASAVLQLPVAEYTTGFLAYLRIKADMMER